MQEPAEQPTLEVVGDDGRPLARPSFEPRMPTRSTRWLVTVILLSLALAGTGVYAYLTYKWGTEWQDRAESLASQLGATETLLAETQEQLEQTSQELISTEGELSAVTDELVATTETLADRVLRLRRVRASLGAARDEVAGLEGQLRTLANEKAQVEDERVQAEATSEYFADLAASAAVVGADLDTYVVNLSSWFTDQPFLYDPAWAWDAWFNEGDSIYAACASARNAFWNLVSSIPGE
jgi:septal ring factor EnvC (AmiA/AmiB activator)